MNCETCRYSGYGWHENECSRPTTECSYQPIEQHKSETKEAKKEAKNPTDAISRQAAIDHWRLIIDATNTDSRYNMGFVDGFEFCISHLSTMPSAQPEPQWGKTVGVNRPLADREIVSRLRDIQKQVGGSYAIDRAIEAVQAQPDIIACGDCKHWICHDRRCGYWNHGVKPLEWCCHAERRTDGSD